MLIGVAGGRPDEAAQALGETPAGGVRLAAVTPGGAAAAVLVRPWGVAALDAEERHASDASGAWLALSGHLYDDARAAEGGAAGRLLARLLARGPAAIAELDGAFAVAWWDPRGARLHLFRDRFGIEPLYACVRSGRVAFASRTRDLLATGVPPGGLCPQGLAELLTYGWTPGDATLDRDVRSVPPGGHLVVDPASGAVASARWGGLSFAGERISDESEIAARFREGLERAVVRRLYGTRPGALLSGGMDSSSIVTFARRHEPGAIGTFGFRCAGASFDESYYARALAEAMKTEHVEVEYGEREALEIEAIAAEMDVPFCDIGINVGTWILGRAARGRVDYVLTGDGGDEWWASHPVYAAQRLLSVYEKLPVPAFVDRAMRRAAAALADSDRKRDWRVQVKRILPLPGLPPELGPFRWRAYATPADLEGLLAPETAALVRGRDPFACVIDAYQGYDGPDDGVSPHLYNDYFTASAFYFRRLRLLRSFGLEARSPFYDHELVRLGARVPVERKLEGLERTKRLFRVAMEGVLPDVVNHRQDKLGHSVPMKLWLRGDGPLAARLHEVLSPESMRRRGLFRPEPVARLLAEHRARRHNHSHRLWALFVLELWLRARESGTGGPG